MGRIKALTQSSSLQLNFVGNVAGRLWLGVMNLVAVPVFVYLLGADAFGIVSLVGTLQSVLAILDLGLAGTVNREVATLRGSVNYAHIADVVRTFELIYWMVALVIGVGIAGMSGWITHSWVTKQSWSPTDIRMAIILGGIALAARWPVALYTGILRGFERQVLQNGILVVAATTRIGLTVVALLYYSPTVYCFLVTQALTNVMEAFLSGYVAHRLAYTGCKGRFDLAVVRRVWRFAVSFNLVGAIGSLAAGTDKLLISKLLPLVELTYYSLAGTATGVLQLVYAAAQTSLFPRMSSCWQQQDLVQMQRLYLAGLRFTIYICVGPAIVLYFFPSEVLTLWTQSPELAQHVRPLLQILSIAILANCAQDAPLNVLIAAGHTRPPLIVNAVSLPLMVVGCYFAIRAFGASGAAVCWLAMNLICFVVYGNYSFSRIFSGQIHPFLWGFPIKFALIGAVVGCTAKALMPAHFGNVALTVWMFFTMVIYYIVSILFFEDEERSMLITMSGKIMSMLRR